MKKAILSSVLLSGLVLSVMAPTASAAVSSASGNAETEVKVNLKKDDGHEENNGEYYKKLAIVWKPTVFEFEGHASTNDITLENRHYKNDRQFIAVNDDRRDSLDETKHAGKGWRLTGKLGDLTHVTETSKKLDSTMTVTPEEMYVYNIGENYEYEADGVTKKDYIPAPIEDPIDPTTKLELSKYDDFNKLYNLRPVFKMEAGGDAVTFLNKKADSNIPLKQGERGIITNLGKNELQILDKTGGTAGMYKGKITWTVADQL